MSSMYSQFKTDAQRETTGVVLDYGGFRVLVARAGGANKRFLKSIEQKTRPLRRAIANDTLDNDVGVGILREVYAGSIILNWETKVGDVWEQGIEGQDGDLLPFNRDNVILTLKNLPDLFSDIQEQAQKAALYRDAQLEEDAGN